MKCPRCGKAGQKVLYMGIPAQFCVDQECSTLWGFWSFLITLVPFNGWFFCYNGNYFCALWHWLFDDEE